MGRVSGDLEEPGAPKGHGAAGLDPAALAYAGKPADARAQFARAAALDLTPDEKTELSTITLGASHG
jgi:hypothetical protein